MLLLLLPLLRGLMGALLPPLLLRGLLLGDGGAVVAVVLGGVEWLLLLLLFVLVLLAPILAPRLCLPELGLGGDVVVSLVGVDGGSKFREDAGLDE